MNLIPWRNKSKGEVSRDVRLGSPASLFRMEMDRLFDRFFNEPWGLSRDLFSEVPLSSGWVPSVDITEGEKEVALRVEIPGVEAGNIDVSINGNILTLQGEKREEHEESNEQYFHSERAFGSFRRSLELPANVDPEQVSAEHKNGVLTIRIQKRKGAESRRIPVTIAKS